MKDPAGGKAPSTGFQNGGWYSGYQYYNGSFAPQAGMIHPQSQQQGAGQMVSAEVNNQTNPNNNAYITAQNAKNGGGSVPSGGGSNGSSSGGGGVSVPNAPTFDLVGATNAAYNTPEITSANQAITDANSQLTVRQQALADAQAKINDNPFYSEATRVGKSQQVTQQANNDMGIIQNKIQQAKDTVNSLKADAAIKVNAAMGQYNINEQAYKDNLTNFNNLVSMGALDNASGSDIANLALQTGMSTSMIHSIQAASQKKDNPVSVQSVTVGNDLQLVAIDSNGNIVHTTTIAGGGAKAGGSSTKADAAATQDNLLTDIKNKVTLKSLIQHYGTAISIDQIYQLYANNSPWGAPNETLAQVKSGQYSD